MGLKMGPQYIPHQKLLLTLIVIVLLAVAVNSQEEEHGSSFPKRRFRRRTQCPPSLAYCKEEIRRKQEAQLALMGKEEEQAWKLREEMRLIAEEQREEKERKWKEAEKVREALREAREEAAFNAEIDREVKKLDEEFKAQQELKRYMRRHRTGADEIDHLHSTLEDLHGKHRIKKSLSSFD
jgi:hypothetical protein